jgi:hypothetical protein
MTTVFILLGFGCLFLLPVAIMLVLGFVHLLEDVAKGYIDECNELALAIVSILGIGCLFWALVLYSRGV